METTLLSESIKSENKETLEVNNQDNKNKETLEVNNQDDKHKIDLQESIKNENKVTLEINNQIDKNKIDLTEFDKKIIIREKVERGKKKTIIEGLISIETIENTKKSHEELGKKLKIKFGCGCHVLEEEKGKFVLIFQGYHKDKITKYIKTNYPKVTIST
jgi:translation initiation factor 1 (eIF-1/SUI1)